MASEFQSLWNGLATPKKHLSQVFADLKKAKKMFPATAQQCVVDAIPALVHDQCQVINQYLPDSFALQTVLERPSKKGQESQHRLKQHA